MYKTGIGQDSHSFITKPSSKKCILAGITFDNTPGLIANSDGDVILHAICNAISSITGTNILGKKADALCKKGVTNSASFVKKALETLTDKIIHVAIAIEGSRPHIEDHITKMRSSIAKILNIETSQVGITATSGEDLTSFGKGHGIKCTAIITTKE